MELIIKGQHQGKTLSLVQESAETGIPILSYSNGHIRFLKRIAAEHGLEIPEPINIDVIKNQTNYLKIHQVRKAYIDDLDMFLTEMLGTKVEAITIGTERVTIG